MTIHERPDQQAAGGTVADPALGHSPTRRRASSVRTTTFGPLQITFDDAVLEPREWTVQQAEWAAELLLALAAGRVLELCPGAGQIGLLTLQLSGRAGVMVDPSPTGCGWARYNARVNGLATRIEIRQRDVSRALGLQEYFPLVLVGPPWACAQRVSAFPGDPMRAMDDDQDGLDVVHRCLAVTASHLAPGGSVLLQLGTEAQAEALGTWLDGPRSLPLRVHEVRRHGNDGVLVLLRRSWSA